jgi:hypothetical protein
VIDLRLRTSEISSALAVQRWLCAGHRREGEVAVEDESAHLTAANVRQAEAQKTGEQIDSKSGRSGFHSFLIAIAWQRHLHIIKSQTGDDRYQPLQSNMSVP